jgi:hypothetical protein
MSGQSAMGVDLNCYIAQGTLSIDIAPLLTHMPLK